MQEQKSITKEIRWFVRLFLRYSIFGILAFLWIDFLYRPWPVFSNPVSDFLFTRSGGPLLYANHVSSEVALLITTTFFCVKYRSAKVVIVILSTASIHEYFVQIYDFIRGFQIGQSGLGQSYLLASTKYYFELGVLLAIAIFLATSAERVTLVYVTLVMAGFIFVWDFSTVMFHLTGNTINGFIPGPAFYNWKNNLLEICSWIAPCTIWFFRKNAK